MNARVTPIDAESDIGFFIYPAFWGGEYPDMPGVGHAIAIVRVDGRLVSTEMGPKPSGL